MRIIGTALLVVFVLVLVAAGFVGYEFYNTYLALANPTAAPPVPTAKVNGRQVVVFTTIPADKLPSAISDVESKLSENVVGHQAFTLELSGTDLMALITDRAGELARAVPLTNANLTIGTTTMALTADLRGTKPVPVAGTLTPSVEEGKLSLALSDVRIGQWPVPADRLVGPLLDQALDVNAALASSGAIAFQSVELRDGKMRLVGLQREGTLIEQDVARRIKAQASRPADAAPTPISVPGADLVPPGSAVTKSGEVEYLALGDSLTAGLGVTDKKDDFVSRFHAYLEKQTGEQLGLVNMGIPGESTSTMLAAGQLQQAVGLIRPQPKRVQVLTLGIGANDLLGHLGSAACQTDPTGPDCQTRLQAGLKAFPANFNAITGQLAAVLDPSTQVIVMNVYNPFDFGIGLPVEQQSNQTVKVLNDAIATEARARGWRVADASAAIGNRAAALTGILNGDVHPSAMGYQAIAYAFTQVYRKP